MKIENLRILFRLGSNAIYESRDVNNDGSKNDDLR